MIGTLIVATLGMLYEINLIVTISFIVFIVLQIFNFKFITRQMEKLAEEK